MQGSARFHVLLPQLDPVVPVQHDAVENALPYLLMLKYPLVVCFAMSILLGYSIDVDYYASISHAVLPALFLIGYVFKRGAGCYQGPPLAYRLPCSPADLSCCICYRQFWMPAGSTEQCLIWSLDRPTERSPTLSPSLWDYASSHIPESDTPFTGVNTMYVFYFMGSSSKRCGISIGLKRSGPREAGLLLIGVLLTWLLSSSWIKRGFGWIVEPNVGFLFNYRSKHR